MPTQWIGAQLIPHQSVQPFKTLAHVHCFDRDINLGRQLQAEHAIQTSATRISFSRSASTKLHELSMRRPLASTSAKPAGECPCSTATSTSFGFCFLCARRQ